MKQLKLFGILLFIFIIIINYRTEAQDNWKEYSADDLNIKFYLPADWDVEIGNDEVTGVSGENFIGFYLVKPSPDKPPEQWYKEIERRIALSDFELTVDNQQIINNNLKLNVFEGTGFGVEYDAQLYFYLIGVKRDKNPFVAFTFCTTNDIARNEKTMKEILLSISESVNN